ncbi:MAG: hypothetical protein Q9170_004504 [Blastenia crenularia]
MDRDQDHSCLKILFMRDLVHLVRFPRLRQGSQQDLAHTACDAAQVHGMGDAHGTNGNRECQLDGKLPDNAALTLARWLRYLRLMLDLVEFYGYVRLGHDHRAQGTEDHRPNQFTIISCTLGDQPDYTANVKSWLACDPAAIIIVTIAAKHDNVQTMVETLEDPRIRVYSVKLAGFRRQACEGIRRTTTPFLIVVDDDVRWSLHTLPKISMVFADPVVGGATTIQQVRPSSGHYLTTWESFGALNLVRRNILHSFLAYFVNGHVLNLSGRTTAYRTRILQHEEFYSLFQNDYWRGRHHLRTGDDNFLTSWVVQRGWQTRFVNSQSALITTTVEANSSYLKQLVRWSRDTARGYLRDLRFAVWKGDASFRIYCLMKILANYTSDVAVTVEVGILLVVTILRGLEAAEYGLPPQM